MLLKALVIDRKRPGERHVSVDNLEELADAFELPVPELLTPPQPGGPRRTLQGLWYRRVPGVLRAGGGRCNALIR